ncbi:phytochelatin synthase family protein [Methylobacterium planeticum]|uniref:glutathione gamma-glutamylcysteinyltransferase n=1 Tax=Methylobacterium planeticum TaxID=2615211 RepID=A0A6N6MX52_9HYPH|nr:phytochelatin synthase family protein [Methylobacterium planeticum]KAB1074470.1 phytochelatin synthase [Methylobacterium planeticum]
MRRTRGPGGIGLGGIVLGAAAGLVGLAAAGALVAARHAVPTEAIARAVIREPAALERAWRLPAASAFGGWVTWQSNPSLCGPASLANVLRSLGEPAGTEAAVLAGTGRCWSGFCILGLTLEELAEIARARTRRSVSVLRDLTAEQFRAHLRLSNRADRRYIVNFRRAEIFGAGAGHHAPIGGYLEPDDLVLVLDVNERYRPWLIERSRLYAAMNTLDGDRRRGLLLIE